MTKPRNVIKVRDKAHVNMMLYGEPGVGKSVFAGTAPNALILANNPDETVSMVDSDADVWHVPDYHALSDAVEYVWHEGHSDYEWVWFDNGSLFQEQGMDQIMDDAVAAKPHLNRWIPDRPQYLTNQNRLGLMIRRLTMAPINFGMTAHVQRVEDDDGRTILLPAFQGGQGLFAQRLCGYMNVVGYMKAVSSKDGGEKRYIYTRKTAKFQAKDRFRALEPKEEGLTVPILMQKIGSKGTPPSRAKRTARKRTRKTT